ncbi:hypothetical protein [Sutcliffiella rhizosphaerae]|uniref:Peptide/nickel transport system permease protein n=1 Tax=Sutcliffiella rhizosphaerae TaxID=2880967 RepID=A0ABN8AE31_9BACI|nr:hypothetical protein [Sutcliffiella rhizosphaerae]CAG9621368.1 hypothetical protein BACCIP111883_02140 [Sutcliffiella rhizosphaerae]
MKNNSMLSTGAIMIGLLIVSAIIGTKFVSDGEINRISTILDDQSSISISEMWILFIAGTTDFMLLILAITGVRFLLAVPLGFYASEKKGLPFLLVTSLHKFTKSVPIILIALLVLSLPVLVFTENRYMWSIIFLALIGIGNVSYAMQEKGNELIHRKAAAKARSEGVVWGLLYMMRFVYPFSFFPIIINFFIDLGRVTVLLLQVGVLTYFIHLVYSPLKFGFGELLISKYDWVVLIGQTKTLVGVHPFLPLIPLIGFLLLYLTFIITAEGLSRLYEHRQNFQISEEVK